MSRKVSDEHCLRATDRRWKEWEPVVLMHFRTHSSPCPFERTAERRKLHAARVEAIRNSDLGGPSRRNLWQTIRRAQLDNPFWSEARFWKELQAAVDRSRKLSGWSRNKKVVQSPQELPQ